MTGAIRQLGEVRRHPPRLVLGEQLGRLIVGRVLPQSKNMARPLR